MHAQRTEGSQVCQIDYVLDTSCPHLDPAPGLHSIAVLQAGEAGYRCLSAWLAAAMRPCLRFLAFAHLQSTVNWTAHNSSNCHGWLSTSASAQTIMPPADSAQAQCFTPMDSASSQLAFLLTAMTIYASASSPRTQHVHTCQRHLNPAWPPCRSSCNPGGWPRVPRGDCTRRFQAPGAGPRTQGAAACRLHTPAGHVQGSGSRWLV